MAYRGRDRFGRLGRGYESYVGEEAEFNPYNGRTRNVNLSQRNDMEEMSWQIAKLRVQVLQMQASTMGKASKNARVPIKDSFDAPHWCRANFDRLELPKFDGSPYTFSEWLDTLEGVFVRHNILDERKVKLVSKCLKGKASDWWIYLQIHRQRRGKEKIRNWEKMKRNLKEKFLPLSSSNASVTKQQVSFVASDSPIQKQLYQSSCKFGQPFFGCHTDGSIPSANKEKSYVSGQQSRAENGIVSAPNQLVDGALKAANQSQSGAFNDFKCGDPSSRSLGWRKAKEGNHKTLSSEGPVCDQAIYEDIGEDFVKQNVDTSCEVFDTSEENEVEDESIELLKSSLLPNEETQFPLLPVEKEVAETSKEIADSIDAVVTSKEIADSTDAVVISKALVANYPHDLTCETLVPEPVSLSHSVHKFSLEEVENLSFRGQLEDPSGMIFPQIYLGHGVGLEFLHSKSCYILEAPIHYLDDILVSKRHALWTSYTHLTMAAVEVHKRKLFFKEGH